jgi:hypothetical protein
VIVQLALQPGSITRTFAAALTLALGLAASPAAQDVGWRDAPAFLDLFTPAAGREAYRAATSPADLDTVLRTMAGDASMVRTPDAWTPRAESILETFGRSGTYDRWTLARLFGSRQARVARGAKAVDGRVIESWTLISPYPDPRLERLEPGTLLIVLRIP